MVGLQRYRARFERDVHPGHVTIIGDTPHDIRCGRLVGARTLAVATGGYDVAELERHEPWLVLPQLPPPDEFLRLVTAAEVPGHG